MKAKRSRSNTAPSAHSGLYHPVLSADDAESPVRTGEEVSEVLRPARRTRVEKRPGLKVIDVGRNSPLFAYVRPGDFLVSINDATVRDTIDYHFKIADGECDVLFETQKGERLLFEFDDATADALALTFDQGGIRTCNNGCVFCFVMQQPKGMRRSLYIMDEDYRYSFTHGNFVTLSNTSDADIERIIEQRLSPLYISVHATNDTLRRCMLRNERLEPIIGRLKRLIGGGITIHTQVVLCPGVNDGDELDRTISELAELSPGVATLALAPVGLTKYRDNLPELSIYGKSAAGELIDKVEQWQKRLQAKLGTRFVWPADEFYTAAGREFPPLDAYEELEQFENGVGMCSSLLAGFAERLAEVKKAAGVSKKRRKRIVALTGASAHPWLERKVGSVMRELGVDLSFHMVRNRFWGGTVTVSGLLTGKDLLKAANDLAGRGDDVILPPNCLNNDDLFLDNMTLEEFCSATPATVLVGSYDMTETIVEALSTDKAPHQSRGRRIVALAEALPAGDSEISGEWE